MFPMIMNEKDVKDNNQKEQKDIGITVKKLEDFSEWYQQVITKSEFAENSAVSGCIVYRPELFSIWEKLVRITDKKLKNTGVKNCYFPLLIPERLLKKEATHLEGFSPEVAWVTHAGDTELDERLAIRPTSETIMYDSFARWIRSWRDLPLKTAQWNNVMRWEFKHPAPLLRGREFLWVEGHTVFASSEEAEAERVEIIDIWEDVLDNYLAIPSFTGKKSKKETFAGAEYTISLESVLPNGKAIQGPDFHHDGQIFAKVYDINFLNKKGEREYAYQNTWAITTRMLGVMFGIHGDDKGLIVPPRIASHHAVIVPILFEDSMNAVLAKCTELKVELSKIKYHDEHIIVTVDDRNYNPGYKFNHWELKGVPLRIELGPKDLDKHQVVIVRRDTGEKVFVKFTEVENTIKILLDKVQEELFNRAKKILESSTAKTDNLEEFKKLIDEKKIVFVPFCNNMECEENIKTISGAKSLNAPLDQNMNSETCFACGAPAKAYFYFGKSY